MSILRVVCVALAALLAVPAAAGSLVALFDAVPPPPLDAATAIGWVTAATISDPQLQAVRERLVAERAALAVLDVGAAAAADSSPPPAGVAPALQRIIDGYDGYRAAHAGDQAAAVVVGKRKRWVQKAKGRQQLEISRALQPCADPCTDAGIVAHNRMQLQRRAQTLATELKMWNAMFVDWRTKRRSLIVDAEQRLAAAADADLRASADARAAAARYRGAMLDEIELLLSITELAVIRAAAIERGLDGSEPDSISGATRKTATAR
ncbi:MAG: hypothetical protein ACLGI7_05415 [Gammaproteobacteria bacterium]